MGEVKFYYQQNQMLNLSRENNKKFKRQRGLPRTLTHQKPIRYVPKEPEIRIGRYAYDLKDEIGHGFSSNVYRAIEYGHPYKCFAIKVINLKKFKARSLDILETEIDIHLQLDHEHIVKLFQVIKTAHFFYLVLQYCPHGTLSQYIGKKKQLEQPKVLEITTQIHSAYKYLLSQGVIHRDIKPDNILRVGNKWKMSDFGFATRARFGFKDRINIGTPLYMAPQSLKKNYYSFKSDFYSIGVVLYQMLVGETPHNAETEKELLQEIVNEIQLPFSIENTKLAEFFNKMIAIRDSKRMNKDQFESYEFGVEIDTTSNPRSSPQSSSKELQYEQQSDECISFMRKIQTLTTSYTYRPESSAYQWQCPISLQQPRPKNPIQSTHDHLCLELQFASHNYCLIQNINSLTCDETSKSTLFLVLFKLSLKTLKIILNKQQNFMNLDNWEEYQKCKLYSQLIAKVKDISEKYQKEYLEFIKGSDIQVIRTVNRQFSDLCGNNLLTSKFYRHLKELALKVLYQHDQEMAKLISEGITPANHQIEAFSATYAIYQMAQQRSETARNPLSGLTPTLLEDYLTSNLSLDDYNSISRRLKEV